MRKSFEHAFLRVVPRVEREEFINVGAMLFCPDADFLEARIELDESRLRALAPDVEMAFVQKHLDAIPRICRGGPGGGPIGQLPLRERWRWLVAPRSTIVQTSAPHGGLCHSPAESLIRLLERGVRVARVNSA